VSYPFQLMWWSQSGNSIAFYKGILYLRTLLSQAHNISAKHISVRHLIYLFLGRGSILKKSIRCAARLTSCRHLHRVNLLTHRALFGQCVKVSSLKIMFIAWNLDSCGLIFSRWRRFTQNLIHELNLSMTSCSTLPKKRSTNGYNWVFVNHTHRNSLIYETIDTRCPLRIPSASWLAKQLSWPDTSSRSLVRYNLRS
jgi:hypothetical protein